MTEIVYVLTNEAMPGLIKIGRTSGDLATRIRGLYSTGVPLPFELFFACEVANGGFVENNLHEAFGDHRVSKGREFFRLAPERARAALLIGAIREVKPPPRYQRQRRSKLKSKPRSYEVGYGFR